MFIPKEFYPSEPRSHAMAGTIGSAKPRRSGLAHHKKGIRDPGLSHEAKLDAATEEEIDALRVDLVQDGGESSTTDGSGRVADETAEEEIARFTEVGDAARPGVVSVEPGRDDTSRVFRRHHPNSGIARTQDVVGGHLDEPLNEQITDRKVDEGTAA